MIIKYLQANFRFSILKLNLRHTPFVSANVASFSSTQPQLCRKGSIYLCFCDFFSFSCFFALGQRQAVTEGLLSDSQDALDSL
jgi:hypothetical protein